MKFTKISIKRILRIIKYILLLYPFKFTLRYILLNLKLYQYEKKIPFKGNIGVNKGWFETRLSNKSIIFLKKTYDLYKLKNILQITSSNVDAFTEIFKKTGEEIRKYLGKEVKLDGMYFLYSNPNITSISSSWHTDNVGSRIKLFICIEGDGSQPTILLRPFQKLNELKYLVKIYFNEFVRFTGFTNKKELKNNIYLRHAKGTIFALDTAILHRGGYEFGANIRNVLVLEFSNPDKHKLLSKGLLKGPIGTNDDNKFEFRNMNNIPIEIESFLDKKRTYIENKLVIYKK